MQACYFRSSSSIGKRRDPGYGIGKERSQELSTNFDAITTVGFHPLTEHTAKMAARSEFIILVLCFAAYEKH